MKYDWKGVNWNLIADAVENYADDKEELNESLVDEIRLTLQNPSVQQLLFSYY